ncbi:ThuA domain-containing protein [Aeoliella sp. SH292]|uniref:ThuA domain-containing protein n=1 Tax=Aeoliella sp. SH292 TaxID=3454464 RepID=UPI003F9E024A
MYRQLVFVATILAASQFACGVEPSYRMPTYADGPPPAARSRAQVEKLLTGADETDDSAKSLRVLLVAGPKDHGKGEHDYPAWQEVWSRLLGKAPNTEVKTAWMFPTAEEAEQADVMVFYQKGTWNAERAALIDKFLSRGGGLVIIHWAVNGEDRAVELAERIGLASKAGAVGYRHGPLDIDFSAGREHPITRNFERLNLHDESYWRLRGDASKIGLLGTSEEEGEATPQFWTYEKNGGRAFVSIPAHFMWTFDDPAFRLLLLRGIAWSGGRNVDRFNDLVWLDARVDE